MPTPFNNSTLSDLIVKLLMAVDQYNPDDLAISTPGNQVDTLGERARICLNSALQKQYDMVKDSQYLEAYPTTALSSSEGIDFIDLDPLAYLDEIESINDTTNNCKLIKKSWQWYRRNFPNPADSTGTPKWYIRRGDRIYLAPRPSSVINYLIDFRKFTGDMKLKGDLCLLPTRYDYWTIAEAKVEWAEMEDPSSVPELYIQQQLDKRKEAMASIGSNYDENYQTGSCMNRYLPRVGDFDRIE